MKIVSDPAENTANIAKHGISLDEAQYFAWDEAEFKLDTRKDYGEQRIIATSPLHERLHVMIFTVRDEAYRIISLRKANQREMKKHEKNS